MRALLNIGAAVAALGFVSAASSAHSAVIDFTDLTTWPNGAATDTVAGSLVSLSATGGNITVNPPFDGNPGQTDGLAEQGDGLGVRDDEITFNVETLTVTFGGRGLFVTGLHFLDLFFARNGLSEEVAVATFDDGTEFVFDAMETIGGGRGGYAHYTFEPIRARSITFTARASNDNVGRPDFALAAIDVAPIPLPAAALLLISGFAGMVYLGRGRRTA